MNVLFLCPGFDVAGLGIGMKRAFDAYGGEWKARQVRLWNNAYDYPVDIQWDRENAAQTQEVMSLWEAADIVFIQERPEAAHWFPGWAHKTIIVHHLGTFYRLNPDSVSQQCRAIAAIEVVDMHDLMRLAPHAGWVPDIQNIASLAALRQREYQPSDRVRIAHAPTDRAIKSTAVIVPVVERLASRYPIDFGLIEGVTNAECVTRKARCDIFVDELTLGYGLNATEVWAMGIPDVSGIANPTTRGLMLRDFDGALPFVEATAETLEGVLTRLIIDPGERQDWGQAGFEHVTRFHSPQAVVERTVDIFAKALAVTA